MKLKCRGTSYSKPGKIPNNLDGTISNIRVIARFITQTKEIPIIIIRHFKGVKTMKLNRQGNSNMLP